MPKNPPIAKLKKPARKSKNDSCDIIYSSRWNQVRNAYRELYPICQRCEYMNIITAKSTQKLSVHHIRGRINRPDLAFDYNNLLTLCTPCHKRFDILERTDKEVEAIQEGEAIKGNKQVSGYRVAIIGNINSGKSAITELLRQQYSHIPFLAIDDYRRANPQQTREAEDTARYEFIRDIKAYDKAIITCVGYGQIYRQIQGLIDYTILVQCDGSICLSRYSTRNESAFVPLPLDWCLDVEDSISKINKFHSTITADYIINTTQCQTFEDFKNLPQLASLPTIVQF